MSNRKQYLDDAKGIGILCIVFAHCSQYFPPFEVINRFVCSFHVPIFFIVSGILADNLKDKNRTISNSMYLKKIARSLLIPYAVFSIFNAILKLSVLGITHVLTTEMIKSEMIALFITGNGTVWFLVTLFGVESVFHFIEKGLTGKYGYTFCILVMGCACLVIPYCIPKFSYPLFKVFMRVVAGLGYYILGFCLNKYLKIQKGKLIISVGLFFTGMIAFLKFGSSFGFFSCDYNNIIGSLLCSICLSLSIIYMFQYIENKGRPLRLLEYYGKNSLIIMLVHPTILLFFTYPLATTFGRLRGMTAIITCSVLFGIILLLNTPCIYMINRYFPWVIGKKGETGK